VVPAGSSDAFNTLPGSERAGYWEQVATILGSQYEPRPSWNRGHMVCPPGWRWQPTLADFDLWFAMSGSGELHLNGRTLPIRAGTLLLLRPGDDVWAIQDPDDVLDVIYIHLDFHALVPGISPVFPAEWLPPRYVPFDEPALIASHLLNVLQLLESPLPLAELEARLTLKLALFEMYRQDASNRDISLIQHDGRLDKVINEIRQNPHVRMTLEDAAGMASLSPAYFSRLFRKETGASFRDFLLHARLMRARALLEETDMSVTEIAYSLGYQDIFLFSRQFKQRYSVAPSHIRA